MEELLKGSGLEHLIGNGATHRENVLKRYNLADKSYSLEELSKVSKVPLEILQQVYNRGIGAARTQAQSVRLKGSYVKNVKAPKSAKLSDEQWGYARVYSFLDGNPKHDNDLRKNEKKIGGITRAVGFVRKAMRKTKMENDGYEPPARYGYNFAKAKRLDKPSKHIQMNIGEVAEDDVVKYDYNRTKKSDLTEEQKKRNEVMKPEYWGLSWDDFEEVNGELVEKKHGLIWRPIYYKPARAKEGCWGLRCCRYDDDGDIIPSNKKYEYIYFRDDDDCGQVPHFPQKDYKTIANPPDTITNEVDGEEVELQGFYAKAKKHRFTKRMTGPFFYVIFDPEKADENKDGVLKPTERPTYEDIPTIVSANNAIKGFMRAFMFGKTPFSEDRAREQLEKWNKHLDNLERVDMKPERIGLRNPKGRPRKNIPVISEGVYKYERRQGEPYKPLTKQLPGLDIDRYIPSNMTKRIESETGRSARIVPRNPEEDLGLMRELYGDDKFIRQLGRYKNTFDGNKWGYVRASLYQNQNDDILTVGSQRMFRFATAIGCNELLIQKLVKDPLGKDIDYDEIIKKAKQPGYGGDDVVDITYTKEDVPKLMKEAKANLKKTENRKPIASEVS